MPDFQDDLVVRSAPVEVRCYKLDDRVGHSVFLAINNETPLEVLRSVEGDAAQDHPPSGPMQEVVSEVASVGKAPTLMGLGSAGKSTWSCAIEADSTIEAVAFDFACKTRSDGKILSTYKVLSPFECTLQGSQLAKLKSDSNVELCLRCFGAAFIEYDFETRELAIISPVPGETTPTNLKSQRRWRYVVGLASSLVFASDLDA